MFGAMSSGTWSPSWPKALRPLNYRALFRTLELACASAVAQTYFICLFISVCLFISGDRVYDDLDGGVWITVEECSVV